MIQAKSFPLLPEDAARNGTWGLLRLKNILLRNAELQSQSQSVTLIVWQRGGCASSAPCQVMYELGVQEAAMLVSPEQALLPLPGAPTEREAGTSLSQGGLHSSKRFCSNAVCPGRACSFFSEDMEQTAQGTVTESPECGWSSWPCDQPSNP